MNDFEKAILFLEFFEESGSTKAASDTLRAVCGTVHENVAEWVEWLTRNNPEFFGA